MTGGQKLGKETSGGGGRNGKGEEELRRGNGKVNMFKVHNTLGRKCPYEKTNTMYNEYKLIKLQT